MSFAVIGVTYKNCPLEVREQVSFTHKQQVEAISYLKAREIKEVVILSTCHRSEIYIYEPQIENAINEIKDFFEAYCNRATIKSYLFVKQGQEALWHLFKVTAGLDSLVLGEDQILGQIKEAYQLSLVEAASGKVLNKIFGEAIHAAKHTKKEIKISEHPLSISHIAIQFLKLKMGSLKGKKGIIIGLGQMNELTIKYLLNEPLEALYVTNRTRNQAMQRVTTYDGLIPIAYERRYEILNQMDFVVSATAAPHMILQYEKMPVLNKTLIMIDIALPRDIDAHMSKLPFVQLYDLEALQAISKENNEIREALARKAEVNLAEAISKLTLWLNQLSIEQVINSLGSYIEQIETHTSKRLMKKLELENVEPALIEIIMHEALKRCMRRPIAKLCQTTDELQRKNYAEVLTALFELKQEGDINDQKSSRY